MSAPLQSDQRTARGLVSGGGSERSGGSPADQRLDPRLAVRTAPVANRAEGRERGRRSGVGQWTTGGPVVGRSTGVSGGSDDRWQQSFFWRHSEWTAGTGLPESSDRMTLRAEAEAPVTPDLTHSDTATAATAVLVAAVVQAVRGSVAGEAMDDSCDSRLRSSPDHRHNDTAGRRPLQSPSRPTCGCRSGLAVAVLLQSTRRPQDCAGFGAGTGYVSGWLRAGKRPAVDSGHTVRRTGARRTAGADSPVAEEGKFGAMGQSVAGIGIRAVRPLRPAPVRDHWSPGSTTPHHRQQQPLLSPTHPLISRMRDSGIGCRVTAGLTQL